RGEHPLAGRALRTEPARCQMRVNTGARGFDITDNTLRVAYASLDTVDFPRDVLANLPHRLLVLSDRTSGWSDLGSPTRVLDTLSRNGNRDGPARETASLIIEKRRTNWFERLST